MTDSLLRRGQFSLAPVQRRDLEDALALCARDAVAGVMPAMHVETALRSGIVPSGLWAIRRRDRGGRALAGVVWNGANLTVIVDPQYDGEELRAELAGAIIERLRRPAAIVGEADITHDLWGRIERWWGPAREVRERQVSMVIRGEPLPQPSAPAVLNVGAVRRTTMEDYAQLLPAAVHMFVGEVGYDPMEHGRAAYEDRLTQLVRQGRSYAQFADIAGQRQIAFKAEVGVVGAGVAQLQGVWTHPEVRSLGVGRAGMAEVVSRVRHDHAATVSLYVNDFNTAAIRMYEAVGFQRHGVFATVMF